MFQHIADYSIYLAIESPPFIFFEARIAPPEAGYFEDSKNTFLNPQGYRPSKTTHQALSPNVFPVRVRICPLKKKYFTVDSTRPESGASKSPSYST